MNEAELYKKRIEKRFLVPSSVAINTDILLPEFAVHTPTIDGVHLPVTRNIYFGRNGDVGTSGLVRIRQYVADLPGDFLNIDPGESCVLEVKIKVKDTSNKSRVPTTYAEAIALFSNPEDLFKVLNADSNDEYNATLRKLILEFDMLPLIPQLGMIYQRRHLHPLQEGVNCRITIDDDLSYYAYGEENKFQGIKIGTEGLTKVEVKYLDSDEEFARPLLASLKSNGAMPISTLQHKAIAMLNEAQRLYFPVSAKKKPHPQVESDPMHSLRFANLINEVPGTEIELKLNAEPHMPLELITLIRDRFSSEQTEPFSTLPGQTDISYWRYFLDIYGYESNGKMQQAFVVVRHPDKNKFMVQEKGIAKEDDTQANGILNRAEEKFRVERKYTPADLDVVKAMFEEKLKKEVQLVATNRRTKYYIFVKNAQTDRFYNIAVDLSEGENEDLVQVEVEYKGRIADTLTSAPLDEVTTEMNMLADMIKLTPGYQLTPTTLTKFQWFLNQRS